MLNAYLVLQAIPIPFHSTDRFQYQDVKEGSGDLGPLHVNSWNAIAGSCIKHVFTAYISPTKWFHMYLATCTDRYCTLIVWVLYCGFMDNESYVSHWGYTDLTLTQIKASSFLVGSETCFREVHHYLLLSCSRSYSSFCLASTIVAKTAFWMFLPVLSQGINAVMISLNQL